MDDHIEISEKELDGSDSRLRQPADGTEILVDIEKGIFVNFGIPVSEHGGIGVPDKPHVFLADELHVFDESHPQGVVLREAPVLMAHGIRDQNDRWNFMGGQSVADTVEAYNEYAKKENLPAIEFVVACNRDPITRKTGIQIHEFGPNSAIAHVAGDEPHVSGAVEDNGLTRVYVKAEDSNIVNLDQLITSKDITIS